MYIIWIYVAEYTQYISRASEENASFASRRTGGANKHEQLVGVVVGVDGGVGVVGGGTRSPAKCMRKLLCCAVTVGVCNVPTNARTRVLCRHGTKEMCVYMLLAL